VSFADIDEFRDIQSLNSYRYTLDDVEAGRDAGLLLGNYNEERQEDAGIVLRPRETRVYRRERATAVWPG